MKKIARVSTARVLGKLMPKASLQVYVALKKMFVHTVNHSKIAFL